MINPPVLFTAFYLIGFILCLRWVIVSMNRIVPGKWYKREYAKAVIISLFSWIGVIAWMLFLFMAGHLGSSFKVLRKKKKEPDAKYVEVNGKKWRVDN